MCETGAGDWTGVCPTCAAVLDDASRRRVLREGRGTIECARCGATRELAELRDLDDAAVVGEMTQRGRACDACGKSFQPQALASLFVTIDRWNGPENSQRLHFLLCRCGSVIASAGGRVTPHGAPDDPAIGNECSPAGGAVALPESRSIGARLRAWWRNRRGT